MNPPRFDVKDRQQIGDIWPRLGIASIGTVLEENNIDVKIIDPIAERLGMREVKERISRFKPDIVGISVYTEEIEDAAELAKIIKNIDEGILIVVGGAHASAIPKNTLAGTKWFDVVVVGEGEKTMLELATKSDFNDVKGIAYRESDEIIEKPKQYLIKNLDDLPLPNWSMFPTEKYRGYSLASYFSKPSKDLELPVCEARGCPYSCIFCYRVTGRKTRYRSAESVINEIKRNYEIFGANRVFISSGTFATNRKLAFDICEGIIENGLNKKIRWCCGTRVDLMDRELLTKMKESGCDFINYGIESGVGRILQIMHKGISLAQVKQTCKLTKEIGIRTEGSFIIGNPTETRNDVIDTIKFARSLDLTAASFSILVPFPGTEVVDMAQRNVGGLKILDVEWSKYGKQLGSALELEQLPKKTLKRLQLFAYLYFYLNFGGIINLIHNFGIKASIRLIFNVVKGFCKNR